MLLLSSLQHRDPQIQSRHGSNVIAKFSVPVSEIILPKITCVIEENGADTFSAILLPWKYDLKAAFDSVDGTILLSKLVHLGKKTFF